MATVQREVEHTELPLTGFERLGLRVTAMVNSPLARLGRRMRIHRMETDADEDWRAILGVLAATNGLQMAFDEEGALILRWERPGDLDMVFGNLSC